MAAARPRNTPDVLLSRNADAEGSCPERGLSRKVLADNDKFFLAEHRLEKLWVGARHSHPHEQIDCVVSGGLRVATQGRDGASDSLVAREGNDHAVAAIEDSLVIDVFPCYREGYIG